MRLSFALVPVALLLTCGIAAARAPQLRDSKPAADAIIDVQNRQYVVRFDAPIDHAASSLDITQDGNPVESLHLRLNSAPSVLFATGKPLPPGHYTLRWHVGAALGGDVADGDIPFTVHP